jgi:hypothetical protein
VLISIVGVLIVGGIILLIVLILRKKRKNEKKRKNDQQSNETYPSLQTLESTNTATQIQLSTNHTDLFTNSTSKLQRSQIAFSQLEIVREIGKGGYGKVCLGKWNAAPVALKFCKKKRKVEDFLREIKLMMYVSI